MSEQDSAGRGRPEAVTADDLATFVATANEPCTVRDFAEEFDVSLKTVRKRISEVKNHECIHSKEAGNTQIFWYKSNPSTNAQDIFTSTVGISSDPPGRDGAAVLRRRKLFEKYMKNDS